MTKGKSKDVQEDMKPSASAAASESKAIPTDFEPPVACIQRVIKSVLPESVQIGKDAKAAFARSAGIFIMYITACANDFAKDNKRSTITAGDVLAAIKELEFTEFEEPLTEFLNAYREQAVEKSKKKRKLNDSSAAAGSSLDGLAPFSAEAPAAAGREEDEGPSSLPSQMRENAHKSAIVSRGKSDEDHDHDGNKSEGQNDSMEEEDEEEGDGDDDDAEDDEEDGDDASDGDDQTVGEDSVFEDRHAAGVDMDDAGSGSD